MVNIQPASTLSFWFNGHDSAGGVVSVSMTSKLQVLLFPLKSVVVKVSVVVAEITLPGAGVCVIIGAGSHISVVLAMME